MKFVVDHILPAAPDLVLATVTDPAFVAALGELDKIGAPELLEQTRDGDELRQRVRYRFAGELSAVAAAAIDATKLSWVDEHVYDLPRRRSTFVIHPDHYRDTFSGEGREQFLPVSEGTAWHVEAELKVRWPVVGGLVEKAIASGLRDTLAAEVELLTRFWSR